MKMTHPSGRIMMDRADAEATANMFRDIGGFTRIVVSEFGCDTGCFCVQLWNVNRSAGNNTLYNVDQMPASENEAALVAKLATKCANDRDRKAYARMSAERAMNAE